MNISVKAVVTALKNCCYLPTSRHRVALNANARTCKSSCPPHSEDLMVFLPVREDSRNLSANRPADLFDDNPQVGVIEYHNSFSWLINASNSGSGICFHGVVGENWREDFISGAKTFPAVISGVFM